MRLHCLALLPLLASPLLAADGDADSTFATGGLARLIEPAISIPPPLPIEYPDFTPEALAASSDLVLVVGHAETESGEPDYLVLRSFDSAGDEAGPRCGLDDAPVIPFGAEVRGLAAIVDSSGNLLVGGEVAILGTESHQRPFAARFLLDQTGCHLDPAFSSNGFALFDQPSWCDTEDCSIVALAEIRRSTGAVEAPRTIALVRSPINAFQAQFWLLALTSGGEIDGDFSTDGWREIGTSGLGDFGSRAALALDARGRIDVLLSHFESEAPIDVDVILLRFSAVGIFDFSIGDDGVVAVADEVEPDEIDAFAVDLAIDSRGFAIAAIDRDGGEERRALDLEGDLEIVGVSSNHEPARFAAQGNGWFLEVRDFESLDGLQVSRSGINAVSGGFVPDVTFGQGGSIDHDPEFGGEGAETVVDLALWGGRPVVLGRSTIHEAFGSGEGGFLLRLESAYIFADGFEQGRAGAWSGLVD